MDCLISVSETCYFQSKNYLLLFFCHGALHKHSIAQVITQMMRKTAMGQHAA